MDISSYLSKQDEVYLKDCFEELEEFRKSGVLTEGEIRKLNKEFFADNTTTLYTIGELVYREIAVRHFT